jgi:hypothetical protein
MGAVKFLAKLLGRCPKITVKHKYVPKLKYSSQLVMRVSRKIPRNGRKPTQQTKLDSEHKRPSYAQNKKN